MKRKDGFIMKKSKIALIGCALSLVAVIISAVCAFTIKGYSIAICCGMIAVFCSNLTIYAAYKKKETDSAK